MLLIEISFVILFFDFFGLDLRVVIITADKLILELLDALNEFLAFLIQRVIDKYVILKAFKELDHPVNYLLQRDHDIRISFH